jgi:hypothetical protein
MKMRVTILLERRRNTVLPDPWQIWQRFEMLHQTTVQRKMVFYTFYRTSPSLFKVFTLPSSLVSKHIFPFWSLLGLSGLWKMSPHILARNRQCHIETTQTFITDVWKRWLTADLQTANVHSLSSHYPHADRTANCTPFARSPARFTPVVLRRNRPPQQHQPWRHMARATSRKCVPQFSLRRRAKWSRHPTAVGWTVYFRKFDTPPLFYVETLQREENWDLHPEPQLRFSASGASCRTPPPPPQKWWNS